MKDRSEFQKPYINPFYRHPVSLFTISSTTREMLNRNTLQRNITITFLWVKIRVSLVDCLPTFRRNLNSPFSGKNTDYSSTLKMKAVCVFTNVGNDLQNCTAANSRCV